MDYTTEIQIATQILGVLQNIDQAIMEVKLEMSGKALTAEDDMMDGNGRSAGLTYGERIQMLEEQKERIESDQDDMMPLVLQIRNLQSQNESKRIQAEIEATA